MAKTSVAALLRKRAAGEPLTRQEQAELEARQGAREPRQIKVYLDEATVTAWKKEAAEAPLSLSTWVVQAVETYRRGHAAFAADLEAQITEADERASRAHAQTARLRGQNQELQDRICSLEDRVKLAGKHAPQFPVPVPKGSEWAPRLVKSADQPPRTWSDNEEILNAWIDDMIANRMSARTIKSRKHTVRNFLSMWPDTLVTQLNDADIQQYVDVQVRKCKHLQARPSLRCTKKLPFSKCPLLRDPEGPVLCPSYQQLMHTAVSAYLDHISSLYKWLQARGHVHLNPAKSIAWKFNRRHRNKSAKLRRDPRRMNLRPEQVRLLVQSSTINRAAMYATMAKCFLRVHEACKISTEPKYFNLREGWAKLPPDDEYGDKRQGVNRILLDEELRAILRVYWTWRERHIRRYEHGTPVTDRLFITERGDAWSLDEYAASFNTRLRSDALRLGAITPDQGKGDDRLISQCFRAFATDWARERGANDPQVEVLRGDLGNATLGRYDNPRQRLPSLYKRFAPILGIDADRLRLERMPMVRRKTAR